MQTPTINVNLKRCTYLEGGESSEYHFSSLCNTTPVLIPCPIPRSVTFEVRLGECACDEVERSLLASGHTARCPARPIRVTCSISGSTWEESSVTDCERADGGPLPAQSIVDERWALVKTLVLGHTAWDYTMSHAKAVPWATITAMLAQRNAVYAALAGMARAEREAWAAACRLLPVISNIMPEMEVHDPDTDSPSQHWLAAYVERLVEQVGVLP